MEKIATQKQEDEANYFAACILIPKNMILEDLKNGIDLMDDKQFDALCKKYKVTKTLMTYRLTKMKIL